MKDKLVQISVDRRKHLFTPQHHKAIAKLLNSQYIPQLRYQYPIIDQVVKDFTIMLSEDNEDFSRHKFCTEAMKSTLKRCIVCKEAKDLDESGLCEQCYNVHSAPPLQGSC